MNFVPTSKYTTPVRGLPRDVHVLICTRLVQIGVALVHITKKLEYLVLVYGVYEEVPHGTR